MAVISVASSSLSLSSLSEPNRDNYNTARALETLNQEIEEYRSDRVRDRTNFEQTRAAVDQQIQQLQSDLAGREDRIRRLFLGHERARHPPVTSNPALMNQEATSSDSAVSTSRSSRRRTWRLGERQTGRDNRASNSGASGMDTLQNPPRYPPFRSVRNSGSHHLLDDPIPRLETPSFMPQDLESDRELNRWRAKRRKLETDDNREGLRGFSYGQYGQVVPGALKMEIVSCDGGTYEPEFISYVHLFEAQLNSFPYPIFQPRHAGSLSHGLEWCLIKYLQSHFCTAR